MLQKGSFRPTTGQFRPKAPDRRIPTISVSYRIAITSRQTALRASYSGEAGSISILARRYSCGALLVQRRNACRKAAASLNPNANAISSIVRSVSRTYLIAACALSSSISSRNEVPSCSSFRRSVRGLTHAGKKNLANPARQASVQLQLPQQPVAERGNFGKGNFISEIWRSIQPAGVEDKLVFRLSVAHRTVKYRIILFCAARPAKCEMQFRGTERLPHDIAM